MPDPSSGPPKGASSGNGHRKTGGLSKQQRAGFERRIAALDKKLDKVSSPRERAQRAQRAGNGSRMSGRGMAYGLRMASELVAAVLVGSAIGYGLDYFLGTSGPWFFLLFFMFGFAAGIVNILRAYRRLQAEIDAETGGDMGKDLPDDQDAD